MKTSDFTSHEKRYTKDTPNEFFKLAAEGNLLTQIANRLGLQKESILEWSKSVDPRKRQFVRAFKAGCQACQAFHENRLNDMITGELKASSKQIDAQIFLLKTQFAADWHQHDKPETTINIGPQLSDEELTSHLTRQLLSPNFKSTLDMLKLLDSGNTYEGESARNTNGSGS